MMEFEGEVMRWSAAHGCDFFDFCGYGLFAQLGQSLAGANQFKRGIAPDLEPVRLIAPHERITRPVVHVAHPGERAAEMRYRAQSHARGPGRKDAV
jgi:hypothetical protein